MAKIRGSDQQYQQHKKMGDATIPLIIIRIPISISISWHNISFGQQEYQEKLTSMKYRMFKSNLRMDLWKVTY